MQETIPENCPLDITSPELIAAPSEEELFEVAVSIEAHEKNVEERRDRAIGYTACLDCAKVVECKGLAETIDETIDPGAKHPLELMEQMDAKSLSEVWAASVVTQAMERGYTRESAANVAGKLTRLPETVQRIAIGVMERDTGNLLHSLGSVDINGVSFFVLGFENTKLVISKNAVEELTEEGSGKESMKANLVDLMSPVADTASDQTKLGRALSTGEYRGTDIKSLQGDGLHALEFNGGTHTTTRGFGYILTETVDDRQVPTIFLADVASDIKGGQTMQKTNAAARNVDRRHFGVTTEQIDEAIDLASKPEVKKVAILEKPKKQN